MRKIAILAAGLMLMPAVSQAKTLEELLVEKGVVTRAEASGVSSSGASRTYWNNGTRLEFPDNGFTTQINTLIQTRYTFTDGDGDFGEDNTSSFDVNRARIIIQGSALNNEFQYFLQPEFVSGDDDSAKSPELLDAWLQWNACDWASVKMGQFKTGISRSFNTSSEKLMFADRSEASELFDLGRQQGVRGDWSFDSFSLNAAVFNGESTGEGINRPGVDTNHTGVVGFRAGLVGDINPFEEGDVDYSENLGWDMGATYAFSDRNNDAVGDVERHTVSVDTNLKVKGISFNGEFFWGRAEAKDLPGDTKVSPIGFYAQTGYFLSPKKWELAVRYSYVDCDQDGLAGGVCTDGVDDINQVTAGINYYWWKHNLKAQFNYDFLNQDQFAPSDDDKNTNRWLFQLSSYF